MGSRSIPIHRLPAFSAATTVVAQPQNGAITKSPGSVLANIIREYNASGFCVLNPVRCFGARQHGNAKHVIH